MWRSQNCPVAVTVFPLPSDSLLTHRETLGRVLFVLPFGRRFRRAFFVMSRTQFDRCHDRYHAHRLVFFYCSLFLFLSVLILRYYIFYICFIWHECVSWLKYSSRIVWSDDQLPLMLINPIYQI